MFRIDCHVHLAADHPDAVAMLRDLDVLVVNIAIGKSDASASRQIADLYRDLSAGDPRQFAWCAPINPFGADEPGYADRTITQIECDLEAGAVGCKLWKNLGMEVRDSAGRYLLPDDPRFDPIYRHLEQYRIPLLTHFAEPLACWQPLSVRSPHQRYYRENPRWHMYGRADMPTHPEILGARDRLLGRFPGLRMIGAHMASHESDLDTLGDRLDRYPNLAIDTSARTADLAMQDAGRVCEFFTRYADRILYGTDVMQYAVPYSKLSAQNRKAQLGAYRERIRTDTQYFESDEQVEVDGFASAGLALPKDVLERLYVRNALEWYPALLRVDVKRADHESSAPGNLSRRYP